MHDTKPIIYQLLPRLFTNSSESCIPGGTIEQNGAGKMNDITSKALKAIRALGVTHVWYTGVIEHATKTVYPGINPDNPHIVKGQAGSPYAIKDYYDIDPDIAVHPEHRLDEFRDLVARTHNEQLKVIVDFVPNHVARQYHSDAKPDGVEDLGENDNPSLCFNPFNNFYYLQQPFAPSINLGDGDDRYEESPAKATGNDCFSPSPSQYDWYETVKLNYGIDFTNRTWHFSPIPSTWRKMAQILQYWMSQGVDGFRCDMAHMVPVSFWNWAIPQVKKHYPDAIFIAELYDTRIYWQYLQDGHFDYLYDKVNLYDTLRAVTCGFRPASSITQCWQTVDGINNRMLNFLENHDEQRIASPQFAGDPLRALPALTVSATIASGPFMIYAGQELGEPAADAEGYSGNDGRTTIFDYWSVPTLRRWYSRGACNGANSTPQEKALRDQYKRLLTLCNKEDAIASGGFFDLMYVNYNNFDTSKVYAYLRHSHDDVLLIAVNFSDDDITAPVAMPEHAFSATALQEKAYTGRELLHGATQVFQLSHDKTNDVTIAAHNAVIWKFRKQQPNIKRRNNSKKA